VASRSRSLAGSFLRPSARFCGGCWGWCSFSRTSPVSAARRLRSARTVLHRSVVRDSARRNRACRQSTIRGVRPGMVAAKGRPQIWGSERMTWGAIWVPRRSTRPGRKAHRAASSSSVLRAFPRSTGAPSFRASCRCSFRWSALSVPTSGGRARWATPVAIRNRARLGARRGGAIRNTFCLDP